MRNRLVVMCILLVLATLVGCAGEAPEGSGQERATTAPTATPFPSTDYRLVTLPVDDGTVLMGTFYYPLESEPAPAVLLLHMEGDRKEVWAPFATELQEAGYAALALDLRGHGESGGERDWTAMTEDISQAWARLVDQPEADPERSVILGAGIGANLALVAAAAEPDVGATVLLSPRTDDHGLGTEEAIEDYGERPVLIVASQDDAESAAFAQSLAEAAQGPQALTLYARAGRGTEMFVNQPDLTDLILGWLRSYLRQ